MEESGAKKNENQALETDFAERPMWLMKSPSLISSALQSLPSTDDSYLPVAKVILSVDPLAAVDEETKFLMELARAGSGNIPKRFGLDMSKDFIPLAVFSESSSQGKDKFSQSLFCILIFVCWKMAVEGKIKNKFHMSPRTENMESYGKLCRERATKSMCKNKQIQVIDNATGMYMWPTPGTVAPTGTFEKKKVTTKTTEMKRTRRDRREMEEVMFNLFERQSHWTLRNLIQDTDQPEQFLKDLLRDLCIYNNKGSNQGTYELKPEYKRATQE
ncbi:hypothetical protein Bca4012_021189 [Brassica carinata]